MSKLSLWRTISLVCVFCAVSAIGSPAQTFKSLVSFDGADGEEPGALVQGSDGNFYGTTYAGGASDACGAGCGTVFKINPGGRLTTLYSFTDTDGSYPLAGLVQATDGNFYGTTQRGGANGAGTVFKITAAGKLTTLYSFCAQTGCTDGVFPNARLVQATDGNFYGTTSAGGVNNNDACYSAGGPVGCGTAFKITPGGTLTTLHRFDGTDGAHPEAALVQGTDENFYGTTSGGGASNVSACNNGAPQVGCGTVFKITPGGTLTTLHSFDGTDGQNPYAGLVQATNGNFYGTTSIGGANNNCGLGCGTVFKITSGGTLTTLYSFNGADGEEPSALVQATNGNLYGTTSVGGANGVGTVFEITAEGTLTTLYNFCSQSGCVDGAAPPAGLVQATNGNFYGTTNAGGANCAPFGCGTVFSLAVGLGPFVETRPASGKVGATVEILGTNLTRATGVTFNGTAATFKVVSGSLITTTVPSGATTGKVKVTTPGGTLSSNVPFRVTPSISSFSPTSGPPGTIVTITGESLTGATCVTFGRVEAASFTVDSYTEITATVAAGAKTGRIGLITPGGSALTSETFTVTP